MSMQMEVVVVAACIVILVLMGMAVRHLSRNKMLFINGVLFIALGVGIHSSPYFPPGPFSMDLIPTSSSSSSFALLERKQPSSWLCIALLHEIEWYNKNDSHPDWDWSRSAGVVACNFQKLGPSDASDLLNGSRVVIAGDSRAWLLALSLLSVVLNGNGNGNGIESVRGDLFKRHSDYRIHIPQNRHDVGFHLGSICREHYTPHQIGCK